MRTGLPESDSNVRGVTNLVAAFVMRTLTEAPAWASLLTSVQVLYAAMPPVTATMMFLFSNGLLLSFMFF